MVFSSNAFFLLFSSSICCLCSVRSCKLLSGLQERKKYLIIICSVPVWDVDMHVKGSRNTYGLKEMVVGSTHGDDSPRPGSSRGRGFDVTSSATDARWWHPLETAELDCRLLEDDDNDGIVAVWGVMLCVCDESSSCSPVAIATWSGLVLCVAARRCSLCRPVSFCLCFNLRSSASENPLHVSMLLKEESGRSSYQNNTHIVQFVWRHLRARPFHGCYVFLQI